MSFKVLPIQTILGLSPWVTKPGIVPVNTPGSWPHWMGEEMSMVRKKMPWVLSHLLLIHSLGCSGYFGVTVGGSWNFPINVFSCTHNSPVPVSLWGSSRAGAGWSSSPSFHGHWHSKMCLWVGVESGGTLGRKLGMFEHPLQSV